MISAIYDRRSIRKNGCAMADVYIAIGMGIEVNT